MADLTLVLMAAGMGSRYGGLKQLDAFGPHGETLMDYGVYDALRAGFNRVLFVVRRDFEDAFREQVLAKYAERLRVDLAYQSPLELPGGRRAPEGRRKPWGTGQALLAAAPQLDGPFCICNADDFYGREAYVAMADFLRTVGPDEGALVGFHLGATLSAHGSVARGLCRVEQGRLLAVSERLKLRLGEDGVWDESTGERLLWETPVSMNFWGFHPSVLPGFSKLFETFWEGLRDPLQDEFYLPAAVDQALAAGRLRMRVLGGGTRWFGVTYPEDKPAVRDALRALVERGDYPSPLF
jgi:hypothetical protein